MFETLRQSLKTGVVTTRYPETPPELARRARGKPEIDWPNWKDARPGARICPTGAISYEDANGERVATLDLGKCIFCGLCADVDPSIRMTNICECTASSRSDLIATASYALKANGYHERLLSAAGPKANAPDGLPVGGGASLDVLGQQIKDRAAKFFGRSLHV